jgi:altronate hydrolase
MDIDCGTVLDGSQNFDELGEEIFNAILAFASGQRTKSELLGYGDDEFIPWRFGAVL